MNAQQIAAQGRYGDNTLVHASADEVKGLDALSRSIYGQKLPRNPQTGLPEAFLFAPFLAPLMAGSIPALAGMGAIGTGLLAGGLGAAEAAARGMDDPLQQGLMAGLTGGAAAGIGNALSAAGGAGTQAALQGGAGANTLVGGAGADVLAGTTGNLTSLADISSGAYKAGLNAAQPTTQAAMQAAPTAFAPNPAMMAAEAAAPKTGLAGIGQQFSQMGRGAKALMQPGAFQEGGVGQTFLQQAKVPAIAGATGLMGQSALAEEQAMRDAEEERKRRGEEARAKSMGYISDIAARNPYSMAGQAYYNPFQFAEGGIVNLFGGGAIPDAYLTDEQRAKRQALFSNFPPFLSGAGLASMPRALIPSRSPRVPITDPSQLDDYYSNQYKTGTGIYSRVPGTGAAQDMMPIDPQQRSASLRQRFIPSAQPDGLVFQDQARQQFREALQYGAGNQLAAALTGYHNLPKPTRTDLSQFIKQGGPTGGSTGGSTTKSGTSGRPDDWGAPTEDRDMAAGGYLDGGAVPGDGMSDSQPAMIDGQQPAALSSGEFVVPADVVSGLGNGSSDAGAQQLYAMMDRIRKARTGTTEQAPKVNPQRMMAA